MSRSQVPLVIEVRANEFAGNVENPQVPLDPEAVIRDALACAAAGATGYHWHPRNGDGSARADVEFHQTVVRGIRQTGMFLHPTLGFTATQGDVASRLITVRELNQDPDTRVDIVPADIGACVMDMWHPASSEFATDDSVLLNRTGYLRALLRALSEESVRVLAVVWSPGAVRSALCFRAQGLLDAPTFWQLGFTGTATPGGPPATPAMGAAYLEQIPEGEPWTVHVRDGQCLDMAEWAVTNGGHVSIGLGDDPYAELGLPTNADLVRHVTDMAAAHGRAVATPEQMRQILHLG